MSNIRLINASCVDQDVDVIVNAANRYLLSGIGVCGEIFKRAGYKELNEACSKIEKPLKDGTAVITKAYNIENAKYIIHAVGPDFNNSSSSLEDLFNAYYNSLLVLKNNNLHIISFPLISSSTFGGNYKEPARRSAIQCLNAYNKFTKKYKDYEIDVLLCAYSNKEMLEIKDLFK